MDIRNWFSLGDKKPVDDDYDSTPYLITSIVIGAVLLVIIIISCILVHRKNKDEVETEHLLNATENEGETVEE